MSKMMKSRVCTLRLHDEFVNSCIAVLCFSCSLGPWNSNDTFPFGLVETGSGFFTSFAQGQGHINGNSKEHF